MVSKGLGKIEVTKGQSCSIDGVCD